MTLYLMRHGEAEPQRTTDAARQLTPRGEETARAVAAGLARLGLAPHIAHSPYVRATQTAQIVGAALHVTPTVSPALAPDEPVLSMLAMLRAAAAGDVLIVSHMPLLPKLALHLLQHPLQFGTATVAAIELFPDASRGTLTALWPSSTFTSSFPPARFS
jgi:phosphohistidine phosphatase